MRDRENMQKKTVGIKILTGFHDVDDAIVRYDSDIILKRKNCMNV